MLKKSAVALSVATLAIGAASLPAAVAKAEDAPQTASGETTKPKQTTPTGQSSPCAPGSGGCSHHSKPTTTS